MRRSPTTHTRTRITIVAVVAMGEEELIIDGGVGELHRAKFLFVCHIRANPIKNINEKSFDPALRSTNFFSYLPPVPPH